MNEQEVKDAALAAVRAQAANLKVLQARSVVENFFGAWLVFVSANDGNNPTERIVQVGEGAPEVFASCEGLARSVRDKYGGAAHSGTIKVAIEKTAGIFNRLADQLSRLKDWQLLLGIVVVAIFTALIVLIVGQVAAGSKSLPSGDVGLGAAFVICVVAAVAVCAVCYLWSTTLKHRTEYSQVMDQVKKDLQKLIGLQEEEALKLDMLSVEVIQLERKTKEQIDTFHATSPSKGKKAPDLNNLHEYFRQAFKLITPQCGGLISRWLLAEAQETEESLKHLHRLLCTVLQHPGKRIPGKVSR
jgi:hypothetical protein